jgi:hypothetical protein
LQGTSLAAQPASDRFEKDFRVGGNGWKYLFEASIYRPEAAVDLAFEAIDLRFNSRQAILHLDLLAFLAQLICTDLSQVRLHLLHFLPEKP